MWIKNLPFLRILSTWSGCGFIFGAREKKSTATVTKNIKSTDCFIISLHFHRVVALKCGWWWDIVYRVQKLKGFHFLPEWTFRSWQENGQKCRYFKDIRMDVHFKVHAIQLGYAKLCKVVGKECGEDIFCRDSNDPQ